MNGMISFAQRMPFGLLRVQEKRDGLRKSSILYSGARDTAIEQRTVDQDSRFHRLSVSALAKRSSFAEGLRGGQSEAAQADIAYPPGSLPTWAEELNAFRTMTEDQRRDKLRAMYAEEGLDFSQGASPGPARPLRALPPHPAASIRGDRPGRPGRPGRSPRSAAPGSEPARPARPPPPCSPSVETGGRCRCRRPARLPVPAPPSPPSPRCQH